MTAPIVNQFAFLVLLSFTIYLWYQVHKFRQQSKKREKLMSELNICDRCGAVDRANKFEHIGLTGTNGLQWLYAGGDYRECCVKKLYVLVEKLMNGKSKRKRC